MEDPRLAVDPILTDLEQEQAPTDALLRTDKFPPKYPFSLADKVFLRMRSSPKKAGLAVLMVPET
jgi:hypothetical protein